jgi:hypothetical protein
VTAGQGLRTATHAETKHEAPDQGIIRVLWPPFRLLISTPLAISPFQISQRLTHRINHGKARERDGGSCREYHTFSGGTIIADKRDLLANLSPSEV